MKQPASSLAHDVIDRFQHADHIELDIPDRPLEDVKLAFEQNGYSVHTPRNAPRHLVANRVEPDRTPQPNAR
ncbi:MAG TPA: hypothetical protein VGL56_19220 [Fimbriimonadaceae bacterium]|jgi:hypothetical protein